MPEIAELAGLFPTAAELPAEFAAQFPIEQREFLVGGELRRWPGAQQEVRSPICRREGERLTPLLLGSYPLLDEAAALAVLAAARFAWDGGRGEWPTLAVGARIACVEDFARRMQGRRAEVVRLIQWEIGKSAPDAAREFDRTVAYIADTVAALKALDRRSARYEIVEGVIGMIRRSPLGVTLCMGPFNYPLNETYATLIPALIMGNPVIFKPPKLGVLLHRPLLEDFRAAFPPGVVNVVYGGGETVIGPLMRSGEIDALAFIGTSRVADLLKRQHPRPHHLRAVLGLEAKNAAIILADADLDLAAAECALGALAFNGQRCTALKLLFVEAPVAEAFLARLVAAVDALRPGLPWTPGVGLTPLPEPDKGNYLAELVADAQAGGARVLNARGGERAGSYFHAAVVYPVGPGMRLWQEEQFGPVVPVAHFADIAEPIRYLTESPYGQQASIFGRDPARIAALIDPLVNQVSRLNLNSQCQRGPDSFPFTGRKASAEGTLSVSDALRAFSIRSLVATRDAAANRAVLEAITRERRSRFLSTDFLF
jgi:glyceraldehyde-3-phosphate dehydrogenase (NADP+)